MLPRRAGPAVYRALGGHARRAARVRHRARLRGPERPRRASPRPGDGGAGRQARGLARRLRAGGRQIDAQPARTDRARRRPNITRSATTRRRSRACSSTCFIEAHAKAPKQITLDLDATDDPLHGDQEGRFFHAYYDCYCYLPLYVFCGRHLLAAKLRPSNIDGSAGAKEEIARIVDADPGALAARAHLLRADSGFCREELMVWCETQPGRLRVRPGPQRAAGRARSPSSWCRPRRKRGDRQARPPVQGLPLFDPRQLVAASTRGRQGGMDQRRGQPEVHRHLAAADRAGRPRTLRKSLLRPRRDGEPDQGMPGRPVRRPHLDGHHAGQPAAALVRLVCLCPDVRRAPHRPRRTPNSPTPPAARSG